MDVKESYRVLELEIGAARGAVDDAYIRLIEHWHPDQVAARGPEAVREAQRMVKAINEAYHTLAKIAPSTTVAPTTPSSRFAPAGAPKTPVQGKVDGPALAATTTAPPVAPAKPKLSPLSPGQVAAGPPPPKPPPAETWAARPPAPASSTPPPSTPAAAPAPVSPTPAAPTAAKPVPTAPPALGRVEGAPPTPAPTPVPAVSVPVTPAPAKVERPVASAPTPGPTPKAETAAPAVSTIIDSRNKAVVLYDALFPPGTPRRQKGPFVLAGVLLVVLLLGKCAVSSLTHKSSGPPDPKKTGRLIVKSNVAEATIEAARITLPGDPVAPNVNGAVGPPLAGLTPGKYAVTVRAEGWPDARGEAKLEAGRETEVTINFKSGSLRLDSDPTGATVRLGATVLGRTPLVIPQLPPGACQLTIAYPGWPVEFFKTTITEGVDATGMMRLAHGQLTVETTPPGTTVLLAGRTLGQTPLTVERFPAGTRKLTLQAKDFPPMEISVTVEDRGELKVHPALGSIFPVLDPAALLRAVWIPDNPDRFSDPLEGVTGAYQSRNGVVKNLERKRLFEKWLRKQYCYTGVVKAYAPATGQIEFAEQPWEFSKYRVVAILSAEARNDQELVAQLTKGASFNLYGRLSAVEEARWPSKIITLEFSPAEPLR